MAGWRRIAALLSEHQRADDAVDQIALVGVVAVDAQATLTHGVEHGVSWAIGFRRGRSGEHRIALSPLWCELTASGARRPRKCLAFCCQPLPTVDRNGRGGGLTGENSALLAAAASWVCLRLQARLQLLTHDGAPWSCPGAGG
ncbi:hypothetical protein D3C84_886180 [compost metagenome]